MPDFKDCKNLNDVIGKVAFRAKALADAKIDELRREVAPQEATTDHAVWENSRGRTRGDLIEEILMEEFSEEFPLEIARDDNE